MKKDRTYLAIDLKSFYASVECQERGLDPLKTNLVVADASRTEKTICLAVSPSLKAYGIPGRARLFEVIQAVNKINRQRKESIHERNFSGASCDEDELRDNPYLKLEYVTATPRMSLYIEYSTRIYNIYLRYISPDDIHVYSIDEVFIDATDYLSLYHMDARHFAMFLVQQVLKETGITATAGIAPNLYLCKCAMDIVAKHIPADQNGVRIAELDEYSYREKLWAHRPLTDFWRVGRGTARRLESEGIYTMGDIARCSIGSFQDYYNEDLLYQMFGINAELLIDHAWGWEPCTMKAIKDYRPSTNTLGIGQVLSAPYDYEKGKVIVKEMTDQLSLELVNKHKVTDAVVLTVGYDVSSLQDDNYDGDITVDWYGRTIPRHAHGTAELGLYTSSSDLMTSGIMAIYEKTVGKDMKIRRVNVTALNIKEEKEVSTLLPSYEQTDLFSSPDQQRAQSEAHVKIHQKLEKEKKAEEAILQIKKRYGKNAVVKGMDLEDYATTIQRNNQIGGHRA